MKNGENFEFNVQQKEMTYYLETLLCLASQPLYKWLDIIKSLRASGYQNSWIESFCLERAEAEPRKFLQSRSILNYLRTFPFQSNVHPESKDDFISSFIAKFSNFQDYVRGKESYKQFLIACLLFARENINIQENELVGKLNSIVSQFETAWQLKIDSHYDPYKQLFDKQFLGSQFSYDIKNQVEIEQCMRSLKNNPRDKFQVFPKELKIMVTHYLVLVATRVEMMKSSNAKGFDYRTTPEEWLKKLMGSGLVHLLDPTVEHITVLTSVIKNQLLSNADDESRKGMGFSMSKDDRHRVRIQLLLLCQLLLIAEDHDEQQASGHNPSDWINALSHARDLLQSLSRPVFSEKRRFSFSGLLCNNARGREEQAYVDAHISTTKIESVLCGKSIFPWAHNGLPNTLVSKALTVLSR